MARVVAERGHLVPGLDVAEPVQRRGELACKVGKGEQVDKVKHVLSVDELDGLAVYLPARQQDVERLARRDLHVVPAPGAAAGEPVGRVVELVRAALRAPLGLDARLLGWLDAALGPAELRAFFGARDGQVDEVVGEDGAEDREADFTGEVEESAVLEDRLLLSSDWGVCLSELDVWREAALIVPNYSREPHG